MNTSRNYDSCRITTFFCSRARIESGEGGVKFVVLASKKSWDSKVVSSAMACTSPFSHGRGGLGAEVGDGQLVTRVPVKRARVSGCHSTRRVPCCACAQAPERTQPTFGTSAGACVRWWWGVGECSGPTQLRTRIVSACAGVGVVSADLTISFFFGSAMSFFRYCAHGPNTVRRGAARCRRR